MNARSRRLVALMVSVVAGLLAAVIAPGALAASPAYIPAPNTQPSVDTITGGSSVAAPYNLSQGVPDFDTLAIATYPSADLLPTFSFGGPTTQASNGSAVEPNVAVYPAQTSTNEPFPSGYVGTPGPLSGYCPSSETDTANDNEALTFTGVTGTVANTPLTQPTGETLPFAPYYFPYVVRNSDGSMTGYFDWRPKDADEQIVSATSTDNGKTWTVTGKALDQNGSYCPSADTNDDGLGHPYVAALDSAGTSSRLYTLQRADGDYSGTNLDAYSVTPSAADPLSGLSATTSVGVDPNTFATASTAVAATGGTAVPIPVSTLGGDAAGGNATAAADGAGNTLTQPDPTALPTGAAEYEDMTQATAGAQPPVISCTGTTGTTGGTGAAAPTLTGCTSSAGITVAPNDDLVQVIGTASKIVTDSSGATITAVPYGPQNAAGTLGADITLSAISANTDTLSYLLNANAPNRFYINGSTVYCTQGNAEPTTKIETCTTTNPSGDPVTVGTGSAGTPVTADPAIPSAGANYTGGPVSQTNGLISPDGIIGPLPSSANASWGEPSTGKVVLYTEKKVNYFIEGGVNGTVTAAGAGTYTNDKSISSPQKTPVAPVTISTPQNGNSSTLATGFVTTPGATATNYNISPFPTQAEKLPTSGSFNVYVGAETMAGGAEMVTMTCTGWDVNTAIADLYNPNLNTIDLIGCTSPNSTDILNAGHQGNWVAGPGAAIESNTAGGSTVLTQIGEGKAVIPSNSQKLFSNNEDYEVVRAAYTTDGINFTDLGAISGSTSGSPTLGSTTGAGGDTGAYDDISNPYQQASPAGTNSNSVAVGSLDPANPQGDSPANLPIGSADTVELRWPGARGTIVTNPDGSIGMFLSGAWASDGDSDAFNQIFYTQSTNGGKSWSTPTVVQSTDYTFAASVAQDTSPSSPLGVSAYYSGRAYDPTVVANPDGTLTMVFAGYRLPAPVKAAGTPLGTDSAAQYCSGILTSGACSATGTPVVGETDPALYRNILTETLWQNVGTLQAPTVTTGVISAVANTSATAAGAVQTNEPDTAVSIVFGTSASNLNRTVSATSVNASTATQDVSAVLGGLSPGITYYYATQATNESGTTTGQVASFTTTGGTTPTTTVTTTTTTPGATSTVTTPGPTVTTPGSTVTTPGSTKYVGPSSTTLATLARYSIATATAGNQKITIEVPNTAICLAPPAALKVSYQSATVNGSRATKLTFVHATVSLNGKLKATAKQTSAAYTFSLKGLSKGTYTLKVVSTYHYRSGASAKTLARTQSIRFKVC